MLRKRRKRLELLLVLGLTVLQMGCNGLFSASGGEVQFGVRPTRIALGESISLDWESSGATSCSGSGNNWSGPKPCNGRETVTPSITGDLAYKFTARENIFCCSATVHVTVNPNPPRISIIAPEGTPVNTGTSIYILTFITGGYGTVTVTWSATAGTVSPITGGTTSYTAPDTQPSPNTVTLTAKATDSAGNTGSDSVTLRITRPITLGISLPNNEIYSDFGNVVTVPMTCSGCQVGDTLNVQDYGILNAPDETRVLTDPAALSSWPQTFDHTGPLYLPATTRLWISGSDGSLSNSLFVPFDGSQNLAVQDPASNEIYYAYVGDVTSASRAIYKFTPDGKADGSYAQGTDGGSSEAIAVDGQTIYLTQPKPLASGANGIATINASDGTSGLIPLSDGEPLAIDANGGLVCVTVPTGGDSPNSVDAVDCHDSNGTFSITGIPSGSQPAAIKMVDSSHLVVYGRGDQTLRWFTLSGTNATAAGTLQLSEFTATDANYWNTYPATGGWYLALVNGTLGVMGQVVNGDGTVSQKLALVDNTAQTLKQYIDLPDGTIRIAPDPTNNAITAAHPYYDSNLNTYTGFERVYVDTGNSSLLNWTSFLAPGVGFLITNDSSKTASFVYQRSDFEPNQ